MKKFLVLFLCVVLLLPVLLLPAAAAESRVYEFELVEPIATYSQRTEYEGLPFGACFIYNSSIPSGLYQVKFICEGVEYITPSFSFAGYDPPFNSEPFNISYDFSSWYSDIDPFYDFNSDYPFVLVLLFNPDGLGALLASDLGDSFGVYHCFPPPSISYFALVSCDSVSPGLADALSSDPYSIFSEIISLLPLALPCLIVFIGVRKGIKFLMDHLHNA